LSELSVRFTTSPTQARLDQIKAEHDLAKAVKSDDTPVPVHVWDRKVFYGHPTLVQAKALAVAREGLLRCYRRHLLKYVRLFCARLSARTVMNLISPLLDQVSRSIWRHPVPSSGEVLKTTGSNTPCGI